MNEWWTTQTGIWIGAIGGSGVGILGGVVGCLAGYCVPRNRCRNAIIGGFACLSLLGIALMAGGIMALTTRQPYHVFYPLLLGGFILTFVSVPMVFVIQKRYRTMEHQRLAAEELRRAS